jgi:hypothetical protein
MSAVYLQNKYTRWYYNIIDRARSRAPAGYIEKHHIIPRSLGGDNSKDNLVGLTAREHFVCHLLLTKMTTGPARNKMISAVFYLTGKGKADRNNVIKNSYLYETLKIQHSYHVSKQKRGCKQPPRRIETKHRLSISKTGTLNPRYTGDYVTPWGIFPSSRLAALSCPTYITGACIINFCRTKNDKPINLLSVCRSKAYLNETHIGLTSKQLGFSFNSIRK